MLTRKLHASGLRRCPESHCIPGLRPRGGVRKWKVHPETSQSVHAGVRQVWGGLRCKIERPANLFMHACMFGMGQSDDEILKYWGIHHALIYYTSHTMRLLSIVNWVPSCRAFWTTFLWSLNTLALNAAFEGYLDFNTPALFAIQGWLMGPLTWLTAPHWLTWLNSGEISAPPCNHPSTITHLGRVRRGTGVVLGTIQAATRVGGIERVSVEMRLWNDNKIKGELGVLSYCWEWYYGSENVDQN